MDAGLRDRFGRLWARYFGAAELPIAFWYSSDQADGERTVPAKGRGCVIAEVARARRGEKVVLDGGSIACAGGKRYLGFQTQLRPGFEYFLSCGIPGKMEGERYKKSPELVREIMKKQVEFKAPGEYAVFKRWDRLGEADEPEVVIFFARPDVLSGLFTLSGFDEADANAVIAPFGAGCGTIVQYPYLEGKSKHPRAVLGMFDVSARPCVEENALTFAAPMAKFERMIENMEESFLTTGAWAKVRERLISEDLQPL